MDQLIERYGSNTPNQHPKDSRATWMMMGILAICLKASTQSRFGLVEYLYSNGAFVWVRQFFDWIAKWVGFPLIYVALPYMLWKIWRSGAAGRGSGCLWNTAYTLAAGAMWLVFWFTFLWGFNYNRTPLASKLPLFEIAYDSDELFSEIEAGRERLESLRAGLPAEAATFGAGTPVSDELVDDIREGVLETMRALGYQPEGHPALHELGMDGMLLRWGTAGFYFPFTGQCHIDAALHDLQKPFTIAHELAHGYGIGSEATCNFIAYFACSHSERPFIRYAGELSLWRYMAGNYKSHHPEVYEAYRATLPPALVQDLDDINANNARYPDYFPKLRNVTYDQYLKAQGQQDGVGGYGKVVGLFIAFQDQWPEHPLNSR